MTDKTYTRLVADHIVNAKEFFDWGIKKKLFKPEAIRLTVSARQQEARKLIASGMSPRKAAKALGVHRRTVERDVAQNAPKSGARRATKAERRAEREVELAAKVVALPDKRYGVIYADPPWHFAPYSSETGMDRAAENHYPTMDVAAIAALDVPAADDCVLFLWATVPMLPEGLRVMEAWGFKYKTNIVWDKVGHNPGHYSSVRHELLLIGTRGSCTPDGDKPTDSVVTILKSRKHSEKPQEFIDLI